MARQILIYTTPSCPHCQAAKRFLRERGVPYKDIDVSRDQRAAQEMVRKSGQMGVPVLDIGGKVIVGFDRPRINALLGMHG